jgi:hypothetical protein
MVLKIYCIDMGVIPTYSKYLYSIFITIPSVGRDGRSPEVDVEVELLSCSKELAPGTGDAMFVLPAPAESLICEAVLAILTAVLAMSDGGFMYVTMGRSSESVAKPGLPLAKGLTGSPAAFILSPFSQHLFSFSFQEKPRQIGFASQRISHSTVVLS